MTMSPAFLGVSFFLLYIAAKLLLIQWLKPRRIKKHFQAQGITGPSYWPLTGSLGELANIYRKSMNKTHHPLTHNIVPQIFPHLELWRKRYGSVYLYWYGRSPRLTIMDPDLIKEFTADPRNYSQSIQHPIVHNLVGKSIISTGGSSWAMQRRSLNPLFLMESLKGVSEVVIEATGDMVRRWKQIGGGSEKFEIDLLREFEKLTQFIIAKVVFGDDMEEGLPIIELQSQQADISSLSVKIFYVPGTRFLPTSMNRRSKNLRRELHMRFEAIIKKRQLKGGNPDRDWLGAILAAGMSPSQIIDEFALMVIAGSETTNLLLSWACVLLAGSPEWQDKARREIISVHPTTQDTFARLKILNKIINEALRLYPPVPFVMKKTNVEVKLGGLRVPPGVDIEVPIVAVHHDERIWGEDANEFNPGRFSDGVSRASKHPMAFMPFMLGPRICIGMNIAMIEARVALAMVLQSFSLALSPAYKHSPVSGLSLKPSHGAPLLVSMVDP